MVQAPVWLGCGARLTPSVSAAPSVLPSARPARRSRLVLEAPMAAVNNETRGYQSYGETRSRIGGTERAAKRCPEAERPH